MKQHTRVFHLAVIRLLKGIITAWEKWLTVEGSDIDQAPSDVKEAISILTPKK